MGFGNLSALLAGMAICAINHQSLKPTEPKWSKSFIFDGIYSKLEVWSKRNAPIELEVWQGNKRKAFATDDLYFDGTIEPMLSIEKGIAYLVFVGLPGAGSGEYASIWRI